MLATALVGYQGEEVNRQPHQLQAGYFTTEPRAFLFHNKYWKGWWC
jgi:hypothetical protein